MQENKHVRETKKNKPMVKDKELETNLQWHEEDNKGSQEKGGSTRAETERKQSAKKKAKYESV